MKCVVSFVRHSRVTQQCQNFANLSSDILKFAFDTEYNISMRQASLARREILRNSYILSIEGKTDLRFQDTYKDLFLIYLLSRELYNEIQSAFLLRHNVASVIHNKDSRNLEGNFHNKYRMKEDKVIDEEHFVSDLYRKYIDQCMH